MNVGNVRRSIHHTVPISLSSSSSSFSSLSSKSNSIVKTTSNTEIIFSKKRSRSSSLNNKSNQIKFDFNFNYYYRYKNNNKRHQSFSLNQISNEYAKTIESLNLYGRKNNTGAKGAKTNTRIDDGDATSVAAVTAARCSCTITSATIAAVQSSSSSSSASTSSSSSAAAATATTTSRPSHAPTTSTSPSPPSNISPECYYCLELLMGPFIYYILIVIFCLCIYLCLGDQPSRVFAFEQFVSKLNSSLSSTTSSSTSTSTQSSLSINILNDYSSSSSMNKSKQKTNTTGSTTSNFIFKHQSDNQLFHQLKRSIRSVSSNNLNDQLLAATGLNQFTILALLPDENAPLITRALRDGQSKWEISSHISDYWNENYLRNKTQGTPLPTPLRASDIQLTVYSEPIQNDTERILSSTCEWIKVHKPSLILSLLDNQREFYAAMIAKQSNIPLISMTQNYQNEINPIITTKSLFKNEKYKSDNKRFQQKWPKSLSLRLSLDPPIQTLANAIFELLRVQYWFDALLIIDESIVSDQFARHLSLLCDSFRYEFDKKFKYSTKWQPKSSFRPYFNHYHYDNNNNNNIDNDEMLNSKRKLFTKRSKKSNSNTDPSSLQYDTFDWMQLKRSTIKKSAMLADTLLLMDNRQQQQQKQRQLLSESLYTKDFSKYITIEDVNDYEHDYEEDNVFNDEHNDDNNNFERLKQTKKMEYNQNGSKLRRESESLPPPSSATNNNELKQMGYQKSWKIKENLLMSIWKNLMIIRVSKTLSSKEFYLRMADIQTTHRRIVLVHCDKYTMKRVIDSGRELDLFNGDKIWILLDGRLKPDEKFDMFTSSSNHFNNNNNNDNIQISLPIGMLAVQNRHHKIYDNELLDSLIELIGKAALNSFQLRSLKKYYPQLFSKYNNNNYSKNKPFNYYTSSAFKSSSIPSLLLNSSLIYSKSAKYHSFSSMNQTKQSIEMPNTTSATATTTTTTASSSSLPIKPFNADTDNNEMNRMKKSASSSMNFDCIDANNEQIEFRIDILRELQKLLKPILIKYRKNYSHCSQSSFTSSSSSSSSSINSMKNDDNKKRKNRRKAAILNDNNDNNLINNNNNDIKSIKKIENSDKFFANSANQRPQQQTQSQASSSSLLPQQFLSLFSNKLKRQNYFSKYKNNNDKVKIEPNENYDDDYYYDDYYDDDDDVDIDDGGGGDDNAFDGQMDEKMFNSYDNNVFMLDMYRSIVPHFDILNLVPINDHSISSSTSHNFDNNKINQTDNHVWRKVGNITHDKANVNTIMYIGSNRLPNYVVYATAMNNRHQHHHHNYEHHNYHQYGQQQNNDDDNLYENFDGQTQQQQQNYFHHKTNIDNNGNNGKPRFRVVTNIAPPFVIESTKLDNNTCLIGDFCLKVFTNVRDDLISIFTDFRSNRRQFEGHNYYVNCCAGIAIDLLNAVARDLHFDYDLYLIADGLFGIKKDGKWDGITADLVNDVAHLSFTAFSTTSSRVQAIDYSVPFFYSGVSCLSSVSSYSDVRLLAFLIPFSYELWAAIFASLVATAIAAAIYEWFSPFGLNPWGRQRTKNFSLASALWVMCSLLFSHLVAFKAPKSWPNKVLINVWGAFSVIFLATYTANIAAHFAGFLLPEVNDFHDSSLMKQRTGTARSSASEGYLMEKYTELWHHIQRYKMDSFDAGLESLRNDKLDVLIGDTAILDYYRANDPGCNLRLLGDSIFDDAYAIGMQKGFPFRESISNLILKYNEYGFLDQLHRKWYGRVHCLESTSLSKPEPLTVRGVAGVFLMLTIGILVGVIILLAEHITFKYLLPGLRKKPKDCFWKSPNLMFFSQKLYRFINTVELVSPHHSAKEIITNLREGQIASLFQKSVKRKAKEEARRRKSKSQFFEMIQEVRKVVHLQQTERSMQQDTDEENDNEVDDDSSSDLIDEEAAINTNANLRVTRPSFSAISRDDETIEMELNKNRVTAIRFREPNDKNGGEIIIPHRPPSSLERKSNLKTSLDIETKRMPKRSINSSTDSQQEMIVDHYPHPKRHHHHHRSHHDRRRSQSSNEITLMPPKQAKTVETVETKRKKFSKSNNSTSLSLENIFFEGILSEGLSDPDEKRKNKKQRLTLSFEDLPAIKKELSESSQEGDYSMIESEQYNHYTAQKKSSKRLKLMRHQSMQQQQQQRPQPSTSSSMILKSKNQLMQQLSKNEIINLWNSSEKDLINRLESTIQQNRVLEEKIELLQRMLNKPP